MPLSRLGAILVVLAGAMVAFLIASPSSPRVHAPASRSVSAVAHSGPATGPSTVLAGVPDSALGLYGIAMASPAGAQAALSLADIKSRIPDMKDAVLRQVTRTVAGGSTVNQCLCWIVSFEPGFKMGHLGPANQSQVSPAIAAYSFELVDATNGQILWGVTDGS